ncbi:MAG: hypothetical protein VYA80_04105 [Pseudomonadota bacterium]|nr:hypothetical protein [Pseudomonadota bacterium]
MKDKAMNGQKRAKLAGIVGIFTLLMISISVLNIKSGEEQARQIAKPLSISMNQSSKDTLGKAFHLEAEQAKKIMEAMVEDDLKRNLKRQPTFLLAHARITKP